MKSSESWLCLLLRFIGGVMLLATFAIFLPDDTMATIHGWLGMGELPRAPIVDYLARSCSALYAVHGAILFFLAGDAKRYLNLIKFVGFLHVGFGLAMIGIDYMASMPWWWALNEGPPIAGMGALIVILANKVDKSVG